MNEELIEVKLFNFNGYKILASTYEEASRSYEKHKQKEQLIPTMKENKLDTEFDYIAWLSEKYENEKRYSKYMESSSLMAHNHIGRLQAMISQYSYNCTDVEKEEIKKFLAQMDNERSELQVKTKF